MNGKVNTNPLGRNFVYGQKIIMTKPLPDGDRSFMYMVKVFNGNVENTWLLGDVHSDFVRGVSAKICNLDDWDTFNNLFCSKRWEKCGRLAYINSPRLFDGDRSYIKSLCIVLGNNKSHYVLVSPKIGSAVDKDLFKPLLNAIEVCDQDVVNKLLLELQNVLRTNKDEFRFSIIPENLWEAGWEFVSDKNYLNCNGLMRKFRRHINN